MKAVLFFAEKISLRDIAPSSRPKDIVEFVERHDPVDLGNVVVAFACVEPTDTESDCIYLADEIERHARFLGRRKAQTIPKSVYLIPFSHLTSARTPPARARELLSLLESQLSGRGLLIGPRASFGTHKRMELLTMAQPGDVAFRDSKFRHSAEGGE